MSNPRLQVPEQEFGHPVSPTKLDLRLQGLNRMRSLPKEEVESKSRQVIENLRAIPEFTHARRVFTCLSYNNEVDTRKLIHELLADSRREVYVPRSEYGDRNLHVVRFPCKLETLKMGLQQPTPDEPQVPREVLNETIDLALVLGLLFERSRGYRLGYGKGFFDRFLADKTFCTIGLAFEEQMVDQLPIEQHDVPLRLVVTEERTYRFDDVRATQAFKEHDLGP
ncbi:MAG: 5-formyltetrahydrofolate cyclo-ligase [Armatimonadetes bacterium]|nr:5-formyltetrahydrofolate cyclo-ligase [Armatimonadota bacterium]